MFIVCILFLISNHHAHAGARARVPTPLPSPPVLYTRVCPHFWTHFALFLTVMPVVCLFFMYYKHIIMWSSVYFLSCGGSRLWCVVFCLLDVPPTTRLCGLCLLYIIVMLMVVLHWTDPLFVIVLYSFDYAILLVSLCDSTLFIACVMYYGLWISCRTTTTCCSAMRSHLYAVRQTNVDSSSAWHILFSVWFETPIVPGRRHSPFYPHLLGICTPAL